MRPERDGVDPVLIFTSADLEGVDSLLIQNSSIPTRLLGLVEHSVDAALPC